ncbi:MAG: ATP-binding protein, partial [Actinomycetota bacterium]|nr:ATP-binding protein [Actinomycetota bacterium]
MVHMVDIGEGQFYLGGLLEDHERPDERGEALLYDSDHLTTHGVIVGMTGSGKTGLGIDVLEEALLSGIPTIVIDPKGDMGNLKLLFPDFAPSDFEPWVSQHAAERDGITTDQLAANTADMWKNGLAGWDIDGDRVRRLKDGSEITIYTPGSTAGVPLNMIGSLDAPELTDKTSPLESLQLETVRDEIEGFVTSLLSLVGIDADPLSSREHILLSNIIEHSWADGRNLDLAGLVGQVMDPPMRKLGVFELDQFFPVDDRMQLAMRLNGVIASPSFATWVEGAPLDIDSLTRSDDGRPAAAVISLGHLSDEERQFVVTLVMGKLITWMRSQPGSGDLRLLVYMDEVFGYLPPTANPPSKRPLLTLLKQARAFGVGLLLSTQNPVDLDYKALSNTGTWMIGRLQTERDKLRLMDGLTAASGDVDMAELGDTISGLPKRTFVLHQTHGKQPRLFQTRWAMSYLAGPLTRAQIEQLTPDRPSTPASSAASSEPAQAPAAAEPAPPQLADDETDVMPSIADGTQVRFVDPAAPWARELNASPNPSRYEPALVARVQMRFDEARAGDFTADIEWESVLHPVDASPDPARALTVDYDERDLRDTGSDTAVFQLSDARLDTKTFYRSYTSKLKEHLYRTRTTELIGNKQLKLYSRAGESAEDFATRCEAAADDRADEESAKLRDKYEKRVDRAELTLAKAEDRVRELEETAEARKKDEMLSGAGSLLGALLGGKRGGLAGRLARGLGGAGRRRSRSSQAGERLRSAQNRVDEAGEKIYDLEIELEDELTEIGNKWMMV